ncbi:MAG TPA: SRPBCC family protein [Gemmatimonadaceae bacterium]|nr:SRPBCC family protein [Gemmatimonadaceae bacterium]
MSRTNRQVEVHPSRIFDITVDIAAPPQRVWQVMSDVEKWPEWTQSVDRAKRLDSGTFRVGSRARLKQPKFLPAVWEVIDLDAPRSFTWVSRSPGVVASAKHRIEATNSGSRVTLSVAYGGLLGGIVARLLGGITDRYLMYEAAGLKQRSEIIVR